MFMLHNVISIRQNLPPLQEFYFTVQADVLFSVFKAIPLSSYRFHRASYTGVKAIK